MLAKITIQNLDQAEKNARELLEHIEAIKRLQMDISYLGVQVEIKLGEEKTVSST